jgi:hypothetical protein
MHSRTMSDVIRCGVKVLTSAWCPRVGALLRAVAPQPRMIAAHQLPET